MSTINLGIIGCDTSHCVAFAKVFQDPENPPVLTGARITTAFPGGSPDFELSHSRVEGFTRDLRDRFGVAIADSPAAVAEACDAVLLTSVDGRVHLPQFREIAPYGKPVFIDKPFAITTADARAIFEVAEAAGVPVMGCSALRYAESLQETIGEGAVSGADFFGPLPLEPMQPGLFWYGIHLVEMLYAAMGAGCREVHAVVAASQEAVVGRWEDGRIGMLRGLRTGKRSFGGVLHGESGSRFVDPNAGRPSYVGLLDRVLDFVRSGNAPIDPAETVEIVRFIEAANQSRESGEPVLLEGK